MADNFNHKHINVTTDFMSLILHPKITPGLEDYYVKNHVSRYYPDYTNLYKIKRFTNEENPKQLAGVINGKNMKLIVIAYQQKLLTS